MQGRSPADRRSAEQINRFRENPRARLTQTSGGVTLDVTRNGSNVSGTITNSEGRQLRFSGRLVDVPGRSAIQIVDLQFSARNRLASVTSAPTVISIFSRQGVLYVHTKRALSISAVGVPAFSEPGGERRLNQ